MTHQEEIDKMIEEFENATKGAIRFVPQNAYRPRHRFVKSWIFPFQLDDESNLEEAMELSMTEANFADAFARLAEKNGVSMNEVMHIFPAVMRMLKSKSEWADYKD